MAKPRTIDLLKQHASVMVPLKQAIAAVRTDPQLDYALDLAGRDPKHDNVRVRFLSTRVAFEVTLVFDAAPWRVETPDAPDFGIRHICETDRTSTP